MPETRDWQEDWKYVEAYRHTKTLCNWPIRTMHGTIEFESDTERLGYWMQEYRDLQEHYGAMESLYLEQKSRTDSLLELLREVSELISWKHRLQNDGAEEALKLIYRWLFDNPVKKVVSTEEN